MELLSYIMYYSTIIETEMRSYPMLSTSYLFEFPDDLEDILVCVNCLYDTGQYHRAVSIIKAKTDYKVCLMSYLLSTPS